MKTLRGFTYKTDIELYGIKDKWVVNCKEGDCEDYALCMYKKVGGELIIVRTQDGVAHMVLDVDGVIVDNLSWHTYKIEEMKHNVVARIPKGNIVYSKY
jgi:predicted transglutaminase-like cysteine proteinase